MGARITRAVRNINAESRAHRIIGKEKPTAAPKHATSAKRIDEFIRSTPQIAEEISEKHKQLNEFLKEVRVESTDGPAKTPDHSDMIRRQATAKQLPRNTSKRDISESFDAPVVVRQGRLSVPMALDLLSKHKRNPDEWPVERLAEDFKLDVEITTDILHYFKALRLHKLGLPPTLQHQLES
ncbi:NADH dehydrogenase [ubiquinone] 1 alpha subcomplex assembly factor 4-like [Glandiceps talaboti]